MENGTSNKWSKKTINTLFCDLSTWGKYCTTLHLYYIPHRDWLFISLYDPPLFEEDLNDATTLMNYCDDLTQLLPIISTITAIIKYGPVLMIDTETSKWNSIPTLTTYFIFLFPYGITYECCNKTNR